MKPSSSQTYFKRQKSFVHISKTIKRTIAMQKTSLYICITGLLYLWFAKQTAGLLSLYIHSNMASKSSIRSGIFRKTTFLMQMDFLHSSVRLQWINQWKSNFEQLIFSLFSKTVTISCRSITIWNLQWPLRKNWQHQEKDRWNKLRCKN